VSGDASKVKNIFVNTFQDGKNSVVVAKEGEMEVDKDGEKFVIMNKAVATTACRASRTSS